MEIDDHLNTVAPKIQKSQNNKLKVIKIKAVDSQLLPATK